MAFTEISNESDALKKRYALILASIGEGFMG